MCTSEDVGGGRWGHGRGSVGMWEGVGGDVRVGQWGCGSGSVGIWEGVGGDVGVGWEKEHAWE